MRKRGRIDANQEAIVTALRALGCSVQSLAACGSGVPDLLVGTRDRNCLLEVKDGTKPPAARKLTPAQEAWHKAWRGKVAIVTTPLEALQAVLGIEGVTTGIERLPGRATRPLDAMPDLG
jgi:hypothetical protein